MHGDVDYMRWERVSEDVVPFNISCIQLTIRGDNRILFYVYRLWAEVFRVHGDGDYMRWERVSEDVVPVNISCIQDSPDTIFQVTAYNRHVEKIFDVQIIQPGNVLSF